MAFHKSCYTARSSGYKYRTLSTNTGDPKRDHEFESPFDRKFREFRKAIVSRVNKEVNKTHRARANSLEKFTILNDKINSMIELQTAVTDLNKILQSVSFTLVDLMDKVDKIETINSHADVLSQQSRMITLRSRGPIDEGVEKNESEVTHI